MAIDLAKVVKSEEERTRRERLIVIHSYSENLSEELELFERLGDSEWRIQAWMDNYTNVRMNLTPQEKEILVKKAYCMAYGDPQKGGVKQYAVLYHNPTPHKISIESLGLRDELNADLKHIVPNGLVWIPQAYAKGGRKSTVFCVAPQLQPLHDPTPETMLDINPSTWDEWVRFFPYNKSTCCKENVEWRDASQRLECTGCKQGVVL